MDTYPPIEIAKPGRVLPTRGPAFTFTPDVLADLAASYDPTLFEAPIVCGHPEMNSPAYGSIGLVLHDPATDRVNAIPSHVDPAFAEAVNRRLYRAVSLSMYLPDSPSNPKPGHHYLRHVGFLGAHPPAIAGLRAPIFSADESGVVHFGEGEDRTVAGLFRRLRDWMIGSAGQETADTVLPDYDIQALADAAAEEAAREAMAYEDPSISPAGFAAPALTGDPAVTAPTPPADFAEREAALIAREQSITDRVAALEAEEKRQEHARCLSFAEQLAAEGKLLPREVPGFAEFMAAIPADTTLEFGEGEAATKTTGRAWLETFAAGLPKRVDFGEFDPGDADSAAAAPTDAEIARRARAYHAEQIAAGHSLSFAQAVDAVHAGADRTA